MDHGPRYCTTSCHTAYALIICSHDQEQDEFIYHIENEVIAVTNENLLGVYSVELVGTS